MLAIETLFFGIADDAAVGVADTHACHHALRRRLAWKRLLRFLMLSRIRWFLIVSGVLLLAIFSLANTADVEVKMPLVFHATVPLAMLLAVSALIGFMVGALWTAWMLRGRKKPEEERGVGRTTDSGKPDDGKRSESADSSPAFESPEMKSSET